MKKRIITFGKTLKKARSKTSYTIRTIAKELGITHAYYSQLENDSGRKPSKELVGRMSKVLSLDLDNLLYLANVIKPITGQHFNKNNSKEDIEMITTFYCLAKENKLTLKEAVEKFKKEVNKS